MVNNEHIRLENLIDLLLTLMRSHNFSPTIAAETNEKLEELLSNLEKHCKYEEEIMYGMNYPDYEDHKSKHDDILMKCKKAHECFTNNHDCKDLNNFLTIVPSSWLYTHISEDDMAMAKYLLAKTKFTQ